MLTVSIEGRFETWVVLLERLAVARDFSRAGLPTRGRAARRLRRAEAAVVRFQRAYRAELGAP